MSCVSYDELSPEMQRLVDQKLAEQHIQVGGLQWFRRDRWRDAIMTYLNEWWAQIGLVAERPKMYFEHAGFRLKNGKYEGYADPPAYGQTPPVVPAENELRVGNEQLEVQDALVRFVKNDQIWVLHIYFVDQGFELIFWKKRKNRGFLGIAASSAAR